MELQALRYAAMVSTLTFEKAAEILGRHMVKHGLDGDPTQVLRDFLDEGAEENFADDVRIVLVSSRFSRELLTSVNWLYSHRVNLTCVRLCPHNLDNRILLDDQTIFPQPEIKDQLIKIREKQQQERAIRNDRRDFTRYDVVIDGLKYESLNKRRAALTAFKAICKKGVHPVQLSKAVDYGTMFVWAEADLNGADLRDHLRAYMSADKVSRYFTKDDDLITFDGWTFALTMMWGLNIDERVAAALAAFPHVDGIQCAPC